MDQLQLVFHSRLHAKQTTNEALFTLGVQQWQRDCCSNFPATQMRGRVPIECCSWEPTPRALNTLPILWWSGASAQRMGSRSESTAHHGNVWFTSYVVSYLMQDPNIIHLRDPERPPFQQQTALRVLWISFTVFDHGFHPSLPAILDPTFCSSADFITAIPPTLRLPPPPRA